MQRLIAPAIGIVVAAILLAAPASALAQTFTIQKQGGAQAAAATVKDADDFATRVIGDPWDFDNEDDYSFMFSQGWSGIPTLSNGVFTGVVDNVAGTAAAIQLQFEGLTGAFNKVGRNGYRYPIDASRYRRLSFRMRRSKAEDPTLDTVRAQWFMDFCRDWTYNGTGPNDCRGGGMLNKPNVPDFSYVLRKQYVNQSPRGQQTSTSRFHIYKLDLDNVDAWTYGTAWNQTPEHLVRGLILELGEGGFAGENGGVLAGGTIELDWVRLVPRDGSTSVTLDWSGFGGRVTLTATHAETGDTIQVFPDDGTAATDFASSRSFQWDYGFLPPGHWTVTAASGAASRSVTLTIDAAPYVTVLDPDETGGQDFARTIIGDAWDMTNAADVQRYGRLANVTSASFGPDGFMGSSVPWPQAGAGDPAVWLVTDDFRTPLQRATIDGDRYHRLTFTMEVDHPELKVPELLDNQWGSVGRVIWRPVGATGGLLTNSQDIWLMDGGPRTYTMDLSTMRAAGGRLCTGCDIEDKSETTQVAQDPWQGPMANLRIDPHEGTNSRWFKLRDVKLAADDAPNGNGLFTVRWRTTDATFSRQVANASGADANVSLYWSPQIGGARTLIAGGLNAGLGAYTWNTSGLPRGQNVWVAVDITDAAGNTATTWSTGPLAIPSTATAFTDTDHDGMPDDWELRYGLNAVSPSDASADPDGDGVSNAAEFAQGTSPLVPNTWILAEGATGVFTERIALANPEAAPADVDVTFLRQGQPPIVRDYSLSGFGRLTIDVNAIDGLGATAASAVVTTKTGAVVAERTMFWGREGYGGHTGKAVAHARTEWFLAEGDAGFFSTYILLANATGADADVRLEFLLETGDAPAEPPLVYTVRAPANGRVTVSARDDVNVGGRRLAGRSFSTHITSTVPITVERAMYFGADPPAAGFWPGGHDAPAVEAPNTQWFVAEGTTAGGFNEYLLLANPNPVETTATITYLTGTGSMTPAPLTLKPFSRRTVYVNAVPGLADRDVSASILATQPIIVERAVYWPGPNPLGWLEAHASAGLTEAGTLWSLAEGEKNGPQAFKTYVLFANPGGTDAQVKVTLLRQGGETVLPPFTLPAGTRATKSSDDWTQLFDGEKFGVLVESLNGAPIVVERSMYWDANGVHWSGGTNETGVKIR